MSDPSPNSNPTASPWWRKDAVTIAVLVAIAAVGFGATYAITKSYTRREDALARRWFQAGETDLAAQKPKQAIADFRTALLYSRDNPKYRLRLAEALAADNDLQQAIAYFLNLWEEQPGSGSINLELARLYARQHQPRPAAQYFNNAIYGIWPSDPIAQRRQARIEYIQFLLRQNQQAEAQAEAVALSAAVPPTDTQSRLQAANLLLSIGDPEHALAEFNALLKADPAQASAGAGKAAFQLGWFHSAAEHLRAATDHGIDDPETKTMLARAEAVGALDPWQRHLSEADAAKRVSTAYVQAGARLQQCASDLQQQLDAKPPSTDLQRLYAEWTKTGSQLHRLARDPDLRDSMMDLAFRVENTTAVHCGPPTSTPDWALASLAKYGAGVER